MNADSARGVAHRLHIDDRPTATKNPPMRTTAVVVTAALALTLSCAVSTPALAKTEAERQALVHAAQAKSAYAGKRYDEAAKLFMKAYSKVPEPTLVYNAARSYQMAGRGKEALPLFRLYLQLEHHDDPQTRKGRAEAQAHINEIERQLQRQAAEEARKRRELERKAANKPKPTPQPQPTPQPNPNAWPPPNKPTPTPPSTGPGTERPPPAGMTPTGRKVVHRPDLFQRVSRIAKPDVWSPEEKQAVVIGSIGAVALLTGLTLWAIDSDLEDIDAGPRGKTVVQGGRTFYPGVTQKEMDDALAAHNAKSYIGNTLILGGLITGGVATWMWMKAPHYNALRLTPTRGGAMVFAQGRF